MSRYCPNCGEGILPDAKKCPHCEEDFEFESKLGLVKDKIRVWKKEGYKVDELEEIIKSVKVVKKTNIDGNKRKITPPKGNNRLRKGIIVALIASVVLVSVGYTDILIQWDVSLVQNKIDDSLGENNIVPTVQMLAGEDDDRLSVINTDANVYWDDLAIRVAGDVTICINGEASVGKALSADTYYQVSDDMMGNNGSAHVLIDGSDFIDVGGTSASLSDVTVFIIHDITETTLGTYTFSSIIWRDWKTVTVPTIQMLASEDDDRLSVINTDANVYWDDLAIRVAGKVTICINAEVTTSLGKTLDAYYNYPSYDQVSDDMMGNNGSAHVLIHGLDFIDFEGTSASLSDVTVTLIHYVTDTTLGTYTFSSIGMKL